jgi:hypothetical protein
MDSTFTYLDVSFIYVYFRFCGLEPPLILIATTPSRLTVVGIVSVGFIFLNIVPSTYVMIQLAEKYRPSKRSRFLTGFFVRLLLTMLNKGNTHVIYHSDGLLLRAARMAFLCEEDRVLL